MGSKAMHASRWFGLCLLILVLGWGISAQTAPAIVDFRYDRALAAPDDADADAELPPLTVNRLENGDFTITLSWSIINADDAHTVQLEMYRITEWVPIPRDNDNADATYTFTDERTLDLQHPLNFGPPTYRLSVLGVDGDRLHERTLTVPYDQPDDPVPPAITQFELPLTVDASVLDAVPVNWIVENRPPGSNLLFEQVRADGSAINAENARAVAWIPSSGQGTLRLNPPQAGNAVIARLSVVDMVSGEVLEQRGTVVAVSGEVPTPTPRPAAPLNQGDPLQPGGAPSIPPLINTGATPQGTPDGPATGEIIYQRFEDGFMLWNANPGDIWVLTDGGQVFFYPSLVYDALPDNPITETPPSERLMPTGDFGRVWGNYVNVRAVLGWATAPRQSYTATVNTVGNGSSLAYTLELPAGEPIIINVNGTWAAYDPNMPTPLPSIGPQVIQLSASDSNYAPGETLTVAWEVADAITITLELYDRGDEAAIRAENPLATWTDLAPVGSQTMTIPATFTDGARIILLAYDGVNAINRFNATRASLDLVNGVGSTAPTTTPGAITNLRGAYQPFEGGFMLWRSDTGMIYAVDYDGGVFRVPVSDYSALGEDAVSEDPPPGRVKPISGFGRVWGNIDGVRDALGWGLQDEQGYALTIRPAVTATDLDDIAIILPSGTFVVIRTDGTWSYE